LQSWFKGKKERGLGGEVKDVKKTKADDEEGATRKPRKKREGKSKSCGGTGSKMKNLPIGGDKRFAEHEPHVLYQYRDMERR